MSKIKPCPFCGSNKTKVNSQSQWFNHYSCRYYKYSVRCKICLARGSLVGGYVLVGEKIMNNMEYTTTEELELKAINAWNNRHE